MAVLVDTSVWIDHLRSGNHRLEGLLEHSQVVCHPFVVGEIACGKLSNRSEIPGLLQALPSVTEITSAEALFFIETHSLWGRGLGFVDIHLLAAAQVEGVSLWTRDRRLRSAPRVSASRTSRL